MSASGLSVRHARVAGAAVVTLKGTLDEDTRGRMRVELLAALAEHPRAVVCHLDGVARADPRCVELLPAVAAQSAEWPGVPCVVVSEVWPVADTVARVPDQPTPRVFGSVDDALAHLRSAAPPPTTAQALPASPRAARLARRLVGATCRAWHLEEYVWAANLVANELVSNAVTHARTASELHLTHRSGLLRLAVRDGSHRLPVPRSAAPWHQRGRGLELVHALVRSWGVLPTGSGGKVVWTVLDATSGGASGR